MENQHQQSLQSDYANGIKPPSVSFEFFPPKTPESLEKLKIVISELAKLNPKYFSVTYGAGGTTKEKTFALVEYIKNNTQVPPAAHLTCVGARKEETEIIAKSYLAIGVTRIIALRGDLPGFVGKYIPLEGGYAYADSLVKGLLSIDEFDISVAAYPEGHPQAKSLEADIEHLKRKQDAGAKRAITQYCFDTDVVLSFIDKARKNGVTIPIVPGILNINNFAQTVSFSARSGASVPDWTKKLYEGVTSQKESDAISAKIAFEQCLKLMQAGITQFHFYTLNQYDVAKSVCHMLNIK